jgi:hypothetical protein
MQKFENYLFQRLEKSADKLNLKEADQADSVTMDIPLLTRVLELVREDVKDDVELHHIVDRLIKIKNNGTLTMDDYDFIAGNSSQSLNNSQDSYRSADSDLDNIKKLAGI